VAGGGKRDPGRWTTEEHLLFLKGLELYGKSWKKISEIVRTRTVVQIRTHAQKYLIKLDKARRVGLDVDMVLMDGKGVNNGQQLKTQTSAGLIDLHDPMVSRHVVAHVTQAERGADAALREVDKTVNRWVARQCH
jgi:SHAQKYF class myb-like DNA-binding protein